MKRKAGARRMRVGIVFILVSDVFLMFEALWLMIVPIFIEACLDYTMIWLIQSKDMSCTEHAI